MNSAQDRIHALTLAQELALPADMMPQLEMACTALPWGSLRGVINALTHPHTAHAAQQTLAQSAASYENEDGMAQLAVMLAAAHRTRGQYKAAGVPDSVFLDTMGCFGRFLRETHDRSGRWMFDRAFWTWRQLACRLFRLGALEYEYRAACELPLPDGVSDTDFVLCVHIPSDAALTDDALHQSYAAMRHFCQTYGAAFWGASAPTAVLCGSWLLAPPLQPLLAPTSHIRRFAADYTIYAADEEDSEFYEWLFGVRAPVDALPQRTSLQRMVQAHLAAGGKIGMGRGVLRDAGL